MRKISPIIPATGIYNHLPSPAQDMARRVLGDDPAYVAWAATQSPQVAAAVKLVGGGATTWGQLKTFAAGLKNLSLGELRKTLAEKKAKAQLEIKLASHRQKDAERQSQLLVIKARAPAWLRDELILVPGGLFMMGDDDLGLPTHPVWVSAYLMLSTPVTNMMWKMKADLLVRYGRIFERGDQPVVGVNRADALAYLDETQKELSSLGIQAQVLLPTEAQWERAAKADRDFAYGTSDGTINHKKAVYGNLEDHQHTASVKGKPANPLGFYGLCGNVWEWCRDGYNRTYNSELQIDPMDPASAEYYIVRGGSWYTRTLHCLRAACRGNYEPITCHDDLGFRFVIEPQDAA